MNIPDIEERLFICNVKNENEAHGIAEKGGGQWTESAPENMEFKKGIMEYCGWKEMDSVKKLD